MSENYDSLERTLRQAPSPRPPEGLAADLRSRIAREMPSGSQNPPLRSGYPSFWARWWRILLPGTATLALATLVVIQQIELQKPDRPGPAEPAEADRDPAGPSIVALPEVAKDSSTSQRTELAQIRRQVQELKDSLAGLGALEAENARLEAEIAAQKAAQSPEVQELAAISQKAQRIQCVNNMKQLGLAVRVYATDNDEEFPPDVLRLTNELGRDFRALVCPSDDSRQAATDAAALSAANLSYEFLAPGPGKFGTEPQRLMLRCPIHGNVTLCDGSVQQLSPERLKTLTQRDGKLYLPETTQESPTKNPFE